MKPTTREERERRIEKCGEETGEEMREDVQGKASENVVC